MWVVICPLDPMLSVLTGSRAVYSGESLESSGDGWEKTPRTTGNEDPWPWVLYIYIFNSQMYCVCLMVKLTLMWHLCCHTSDMVYCGVYDNALDNDNYNLARGFNYHQGPVSGIIIISSSKSSGLLVCCLSFTLFIFHCAMPTTTVVYFIYIAWAKVILTYPKNIKPISI